MATNDNAQPLLVAGKLPKQCYTDLDEFVQDLAKVLALPLDAVAIIKGAAGEPGPRGAPGAAGPQGPVGPGVVKVFKSFPIPTDVAFVEFDTFLGWESAIYSIRYDGSYGSLLETINNFDPVNGIVGPGTTVGVFNTVLAPAPNKLRHYFTFAGGIEATPDENFILDVTKLQ